MEITLSNYLTVKGKMDNSWRRTQHQERIFVFFKREDLAMQLLGKIKQK